MHVKNHPQFEITPELLDAIRTFPLQREVEHCGTRIVVSPFAIYADCPRCGSRIKVRSFSASAELEDVFDSVFEWLNQPGAQEVAQQRPKILAETDED